MTATVEATLGPDSGLGAEIALYRHEAVEPLALQSVRLVRPSSLTRNVVTDGTESEQTDVFVVGLPGLDIQARDRFTLDGVIYEVNGVQPLRQIDTVASVRIVQ